MGNKRAVAAILTALFLIASTGLCAEQPKELTVFCGAGLMSAFSELGEIYKNESDASVAFNFDGAQILRAQIKNGAYADVLAIPNDKNLKALKSEGFLNNSSISVFARNWQEIIVPKSNPAKIQNLSDLAKPGVKIVTGAKDLPITNTTLQILDKLAADPAYGPGYKEKVLANMVSQETNINFIVSKVALGEADAAFIHESEVSPEYADKLIVIDIPEKYNVKSEFTIGVLNQSKSFDLAERFINLVKSDEGKAIFEKDGYEPA
ncbi:MAG: molybdate ABC transporter periplasmic molybdate-binding protein [Methanosaeta sp. PtaU1.Bin060]|nr:MAG: molybdate ABC transporter periplasmic molybdate-binding protein [Methanosaeta sp. PtaU1.Bin060]